jgi:hypothetical protein
VRFTAMNRAHRGRLALTAAALGIGLLASGCGYTNPQQTSEQYQSSDGIIADLGPLKLRNILIVSAGEDQPGRVIGAVYNSSSQDVTLTMKGAQGAQAQVPVEANSYTLLNESSDEVILSTTGGQPGSLVDIQATESGTNVNSTIKVPVLDVTLPEYKQFLPAGSTTSPTPTPSPTASERGGGNTH